LLLLLLRHLLLWHLLLQLPPCLRARLLQWPCWYGPLLLLEADCSSRWLHLGPLLLLHGLWRCAAIVLWLLLFVELATVPARQHTSAWSCLSMSSGALLHLP
jgi:hypothetical protein